ncbi:MAG: SRPBCC family protein [Longimicrobiales bacterium]|nr:SRPBCC family protein [Longimicrobiales bacterium]
MYCLRQKQILPISRSVLWDFVSSPENLNRITPPEMGFQIIGEASKQIASGDFIEYRVKVPVLGRISWLTEIKYVENGFSFVDEQRVGPYKLWIHHHRLLEVEGGTSMTDEIRYVLPFGYLGKFSHCLFVRRNLESIFRFRRQALEEIFLK